MYLSQSKNRRCKSKVWLVNTSFNHTCMHIHTYKRMYILTYASINMYVSILCFQYKYSRYIYFQKAQNVERNIGLKSKLVNCRKWSSAISSSIQGAAARAGDLNLATKDGSSIQQQCRRHHYSYCETEGKQNTRARYWMLFTNLHSLAAIYSRAHDKRAESRGERANVSISIHKIKHKCTFSWRNWKALRWHNMLTGILVSAKENRTAGFFL